MMNYDRRTAIEMLGTVLSEHNLVTPVMRGIPGQPGSGGETSSGQQAQSQAADLLDEYMINAGRDSDDEKVPCKLVQNAISDLLDQVEERDGARPEMPVAFGA